MKTCEKLFGILFFAPGFSLLKMAQAGCSLGFSWVLDPFGVFRGRCLPKQVPGG